MRRPLLTARHHPGGGKSARMLAGRRCAEAGETASLSLAPSPQSLCSNAHHARSYFHSTLDSDIFVHLESEHRWRGALRRVLEPRMDRPIWVHWQQFPQLSFVRPSRRQWQFSRDLPLGNDGSVREKLHSGQRSACGDARMPSRRIFDIGSIGRFPRLRCSRRELIGTAPKTRCGYTGTIPGWLPTWATTCQRGL